MRLTVIGCSGSFPGPDSPASCYLVEAEPGPEGQPTRILLDLGSGALGRLQEYVDPLTIDAVLLTHLHADHFFDMSGYYVMRKYHPEGPQPRIPAYGPKQTADRLARAYGLPLDPGMHEEFDFRLYGDEPIEVGPFTIETSRVVHPIETRALRVTDGAGVLVYSADTGACDALVELAKDADLFLAEASFRVGGEYPEQLHMNGREAGQAAADAGVGTLVLTHIPPWSDKETAREEARTVFDGTIDIARTGATYDV